MPTDFTLDTSGAIELFGWQPHWGRNQFVAWRHLSPFEQGYVEAMFASDVAGEDGSPDIRLSVCRKFSALAPETLAAIRKDCTLARSVLGFEDTAGQGYKFYERRQRGDYLQFPPRTVFLDDGKIYAIPQQGERDSV